MSWQSNNLKEKTEERAPKLWGWHTFISIAIALIILVWILTMIDLKRVWTVFLDSDKGLIVLGCMFHYATYPVRGLRWRHSLKHFPLKGSKGLFGLLVFFYNFIDNIVPAKLGDIYGAHLGRINFGVRRSAVMGSIVFLRMVDAWILLILALIGSWSLFSAKLPQSVKLSITLGGIIALAITCVMVLFFILRKSVPRWIPKIIEQRIHAFHEGMLPKAAELPAIAFYTVMIWVLEILWIYSLTLAFQLNLGLDEILFVTVIPLIASAFPITPSGAGVVELTLFGCLRLVGVSSPVSTSLTVVNRFLDYWLHILLGFVTWAISKKIGLRIWREAPSAHYDRDADAHPAGTQEHSHGH